jgi:hypothetical protein
MDERCLERQVRQIRIAVAKIAPGIMPASQPSDLVLNVLNGGEQYVFGVGVQASRGTAAPKNIARAPDVRRRSVARNAAPRDRRQMSGEVRDNVAVSDAFLTWGRQVINRTADRLEQEIPGSTRGNESRLPDYEPSTSISLTCGSHSGLRCGSTRRGAGAPYNVHGYPDVIAVGLKHDADQELVRGEWKLRPLAPFSWRTHVDDRWEGYRWLRRAGELSADPASAACTPRCGASAPATAF